MESYHLLISAYVLFSASFMFAHARDFGHASSLPADEYYWKALWPNTPIPSSLQVLLKQDPTGVELSDIPMQIDDTQYPSTVFPQRDLYPGKTLNLHFTNIPFADAVNTAYHYMNEIKDEYTFKDMCINRSVKGEERFCAKSLGTIIDFVTSKLGKNTQVVSGSFVNNQEEYTVEGVQNLGTKAVMCHWLNFNKIVFFCHEITHTTVFMVPMVASDGTKTQALAICHTHILGMDDAFIEGVIKFNPKNNPFCHFSEDKTVAWVPNSAVDKSYGDNVVI